MTTSGCYALNVSSSNRLEAERRESTVHRVRAVPICSEPADEEVTSSMWHLKTARLWHERVAAWSRETTEYEL